MACSVRTACIYARTNMYKHNEQETNRNYCGNYEKRRAKGNKNITSSGRTVCNNIGAEERANGPGRGGIKILRRAMYISYRGLLDYRAMLIGSLAFRVRPEDFEETRVFDGEERIYIGAGIYTTGPISSGGLSAMQFYLRNDIL